MLMGMGSAGIINPAMLGVLPAGLVAGMLQNAAIPGRSAGAWHQPQCAL